MRYLNQDLSIACGTSTHQFMKVIGGAVIAVAGFGIPLLLAQTLRRRRALLLTRATFASLGFLYDGLDVPGGKYAFESLVMLRKAGAVMIGNLVVDAHAQLTSALLLLTNAAIVQLLLQPFASSLWAALDTLSLCSLLATLVLSLMYLRWSTPANMCAGLSETDVLPGTVLTCAQVREEAHATERLVTVLLLGLHAFVFAAFALVFIRLWFVRRKRAALRQALVDAAGAKAAFAARRQVLQVVAARPQLPADSSNVTVSSESASKTGPADSASELDRLVFAAVHGFQAKADAEHPTTVTRAAVATSSTRASASGAASWCSCCCRRAVTTPLASRNKRPSAVQRASTAAIDFVKRRLQQQAAAAPPGSAVVAAHASGITPELVTRAAAVLTAAYDGRRDAAHANRPLRRWLARGAASLLAALDARLHAVCAASEATTALVFGDATTSTGGVALQTLPAQLSTVPTGKLSNRDAPLASVPAQVRPQAPIYRPSVVLMAHAEAAALTAVADGKQTDDHHDHDASEAAASKASAGSGAPSVSAASTILAVGKSARHVQPERRSFVPAVAAGVSRPSVIRRLPAGQRYSTVPQPLALLAVEEAVSPPRGQRYSTVPQPLVPLAADESVAPATSSRDQRYSTAPQPLIAPAVEISDTPATSESPAWTSRDNL